MKTDKLVITKRILIRKYIFVEALIKRPEYMMQFNLVNYSFLFIKRRKKTRNC